MVQRSRDTVTLDATFGPVDLGTHASQQTTYSIGTEHAEDSVVDLFEAIEFHADLKNLQLDTSHVLKINNLTASPCSSTYGTCKKGDMDGCAERLVELAGRGFKIEVHADHYYQPKGVRGAKSLSKKACEMMESAGIKVTVDKK
ncbi:hypothetical protein [Silvibacterium sp.]|uniref:hypothetical protein n=1 Tax=Silvibacterium sp. TaxID=1964179 RepID=UPI0039E286CC